MRSPANVGIKVLACRHPAPELRRRRFHPWVGKTPWRRKCQPTPLFLPGKFHGHRSLGLQSMGSQGDRHTRTHTHGGGESMELERIVSAALLAFVQTHLPEADLSGLDDVIFSYVLGVLGDLGPSGPSEENFDMEAFTEMMEAYVPGFAHIPRGTIGDMIQKLSGQLSGARNKENVQPQSSEVQGQVSISPEPLQRPEKLKEEMMSSAGDTQDEAAGPEEELLPGVDVLLEVFPTCSVEQAQWVLAKARGDLEEAVQMLVEGKQGPPAWDGPNQDLPRRLRGPQKDELKSFILQKYMMVDSAEDQKIHRPMAPKEAPKKLIRYIDNQIVSTKGERFKDVRNPEAEEMKATYINLKPARKYRFH